jgi:hypothetical protein
MEDRNAKLNLVRGILRSPLFQSKPLEEQQAILDQVTATGEVSRQDILELIQEEVQESGLEQQSTLSIKEITYLEKLPYNVFLKIIFAGNLEGKDLIGLCNSSRVLSDKCNRSFKIEGTAQEIPQYLFYLMLIKLGLEPSVERLNSGESYREQYLKAIKNMPIHSLNRKFAIIAELSRYDPENEGVVVFPGNLFDLLYNQSDSTIGFLDRVLFIYSVPKDINDAYNNIIKLIKILYDIRNDAIAHGLWKSRDPDGWIKAFKYSAELPEIAKAVGKSFEEFIGNDYPMYIGQRTRMRLGGNISLDNLLNVNQIFARAVEEVFRHAHIYERGILSDDGIKQLIRSRWNDIINILLGVYQKQLEGLEEDINNGVEVEAAAEPTRRNIKLLLEIQTLSDEELNYLLYLHKKVVNGEIPVLTLFNFEDLSKY